MSAPRYDLPTADQVQSMTDTRPELPDQPEKVDPHSQDVAEERRRELVRLFPEVRTEGGKVDFDRLRLALGEAVDVGKERYGLTWPGKAECFKVIQTPSLGTLRPSPEESVKFNTSENVIIEGDNLEALKLLQKAYQGKVKMIYIDPPYNTGKDFIYPDNYTESLQTYLEYTGQLDAEGKVFGTNAETDGRFHSKWLTMMYPRLYLARNLLRDDGVLFISIDDTEVDNLKKICTEIFGEENFVAVLSVLVNPRGRHLDKFIAKTHDSVVVLVKNADNRSSILGMAKEGEMLEEYTEEDEHGRFRALGLRNRNQAFNPKTRPNLFFPLYVDPATGRVSLEKRAPFTEQVLPVTADGVETCWTWGREKIAEENALLTAKRMEDGSWRVFRKDYLYGDDGEVAVTLAKSLWLDKEFTNDYGRKAIKDLFGSAIMDFPKSPHLIQRMIAIGTGEGDLVLDFFAGSGTTAEALFNLNAQDGGSRRFILVQLPEPTGREDYPTIAEICKERVRRVIKKLNEEDAGKLALEGAKLADRGFRVFKLADSNLKTWEAGKPKDAEALGRQLDLHVDHLRGGRDAADLLYEILLKSGFSLTTPVDTVTLADKNVHSAAGGAFLVCLERELTLDLIRAIADKKPERVVCLDAGFAGNDQLKANAVQIFKTKGVTSFKTV
jgi:adenine-specific DNA-methyltransferase